MKNMKKNIASLPTITRVADMSKAQIKEMMDIDTQITIFQVEFLEEAATNPYLELPLWLIPTMEAYMQDSPWEREFLQIRDLERLQLIQRMQLKGKKNEFWQLTARGRLVVIWHLDLAENLQSQIDITMTDSD